MSTLLAPRLAPDQPAAITIPVAMGRTGIAQGTERLHTVGLGSCVAIILFAPENRFAGLAHIMLPERDGGEGPASKFADTAVPALRTLLIAAGAEPRFTAAIIGGASMFPGVPTEFMQDIGANNVLATRFALANASIPILIEDVGGTVGRSVTVDAEMQRVLVKTIRGGERWL